MLSTRCIRLVVLLTFSSTLAIASRLSSQVEWHREGSGPVLTPATAGGDSLGEPFALREGDLLTLWYQVYGPTGGGVARAISVDGFDWMPDAGLALAALPGTWESYLYAPRVSRTPSGYLMWYSGNDSSRCNVGVATSADGQHWTRHEANPVLSPSQAWEQTCSDLPSVLSDGAAYRMWYTGGSITDYAEIMIGYATSSDGLSWVKYPGNPVLREGSSEVPRGAAIPCVLLDAQTSRLEMWYTFLPRSDGMQSSISFAASMDGVAWAKHPGNPVLAAGALDSQALSPAVLFDGNEYHMWYYGAFSGRVGLSYATAPWSIPKAAFSATHAEAFDGEPVSFDAAAAVSPNGEIASYRWDFGDGATAEGATISHAYARPGHYTVTLTAIDAAGKEGSVARAIDVRLRRGDISPWQGQDVGEHELPSGARFEGSAEAGLIRLHTRGGDIGLRADAFQLVSRELQGDFTLTARVEAREATSAAGKVGLMVREGADPEARHAAIVLQGAPGSRRLRWIRRLTRGGTSLASAGPAVPAEASPWLRLERRGSVVSAFTLEGDAWQPVGEPVAFDPPLGALLHAGVAAAAGQSGAEGGHQDLLASIGGLEVTQGIGPFLRGDCNGDGEVEGQVTDAVFLLAYSFTGGAAPACLAACDSNGDGATDISDAVHLLGFNFLGGSAPSAPFPLCGPSETESDRALGCATSLASCQ